MHRRSRAVLTVASIAVALAAADTYVVVLALTEMMAGVGLGVQDIHRATPIVSGFLIGYLAALPLVGRIADLISRSQVLLGCLALFTVGSVVTAVAVDLPVLVAGRVVQGVGGGGLVPATLALVADLWPAHRRGLALGVVGAVQEVGSVLGPVLGAVLLSMGGWRLIFWVNAVGGLILAAGIRLLPTPDPVARPGPAGRLPAVPEARDGSAAGPLPVILALTGLGITVLALIAPDGLTRHVTWGLPFVRVAGQTRLGSPLGLLGLALLILAAGWGWRSGRSWTTRVDLTGAALLSLTLGSLVLTFATANPEREVIGPLGWALVPVGLVAAVGWALRQRTAAHPLVPAGLVRGRLAIALAVSLCTGVALVAVIVDVPLLARLTLTDSQVDAALVLVRFLVAVPVGALAGGWALRAMSAGSVAALGLLIAAAALWVMRGWGRDALAANPAEGDPGAVAGTATATLVLVGLGLGLAIAPVNAAALAEVGAGRHGVASGLVVLARMVGMVTGLAALTAVGLRQYYLTVQALPAPVDPATLLDAALVQTQTVFAGAGVVAAAGAVLAVTLARSPSGRPHPRTAIRTGSQ